MEDSVDREQGQLVVQGRAVLLRLPGGGLHGDYHVAEVFGLVRQCRRGNLRSARALVALGEGEHVCGLVLVAVIAVQRVDGLVVGEEEADFRVGGSLSVERPFARVQERLRVERNRLGVEDSDRHGRLRGAPPRCVVLPGARR